MHCYECICAKRLTPPAIPERTLGTISKYNVQICNI